MEWFTYRRSPEEIAILRENTDRRFRREVYKVLHMPSSLRNKYIETLPKELSDRVEKRIRQLTTGRRYESRHGG